MQWEVGFGKGFIDFIELSAQGLLLSPPLGLLSFQHENNQTARGSLWERYPFPTVQL